MPLPSDSVSAIGSSGRSRRMRGREASGGSSPMSPHVAQVAATAPFRHDGPAAPEQHEVRCRELGRQGAVGHDEVPRPRAARAASTGDGRGSTSQSPGAGARGPRSDRHLRDPRRERDRGGRRVAAGVGVDLPRDPSLAVPLAATRAAAAGPGRRCRRARSWPGRAAPPGPPRGVAGREPVGPARITRRSGWMRPPGAPAGSRVAAASAATTSSVRRAARPAVSCGWVALIPWGPPCRSRRWWSHPSMTRTVMIGDVLPRSPSVTGAANTAWNS